MTVTARVRQQVWDREDSCCAVCARPIGSGYYSLQHRRARGMGGSRLPDTNSVTNLVLCCGSATSAGGCHQQIESHPTWADHFGYRVPQGCDPSLVPIWIARVGWQLLNADGSYQPCEDPDYRLTRVLETTQEVFTDMGEVS